MPDMSVEYVPVRGLSLYSYPWVMSQCRMNSPSNAKL